MKGRKPTPASLRAITGRGKPAPALCATGQPSPPAFLSERGAQFWPGLADMLAVRGVLTEADGLALAMLCEALGDWQAARDAIEAAGGETYEAQTESGAIMFRAHPAVAMRNDAWRRLQAGMAEFGLTPASREKVAADLGTLDPLAGKYFE
jgi:P27 family predicted phage terminase small subunit